MYFVWVFLPIKSDFGHSLILTASFRFFSVDKLLMHLVTMSLAEQKLAEEKLTNHSRDGIKNMTESGRCLWCSVLAA